MRHPAAPCFGFNDQEGIECCLAEPECGLMNHGKCMLKKTNDNFEDMFMCKECGRQGKSLFVEPGDSEEEYSETWPPPFACPRAVSSIAGDAPRRVCSSSGSRAILS